MLKRTFAVIAITALLVTCILPFGAIADPAVDPFDPSAYGLTGTLTQTVGFDSYDAGTNLVTAGIVTDSDADTQTLTIAQGGLSGNALQWHAIAADSKRVTIPLQAGDVTDWTDAQELWVYVDQSAYMKPGSTNYTPNSNSFGLGFVAGGTALSYVNGAAVQYYENGQWVISPSVEWGRAAIPGHYKGWVRVELNAANFGGLDMTKLNNVTALTIEVGHPAGAYVDNQADNACLVDAVCVLTGKQISSDPSAYGVTGTLTQAAGFDSFDAGTNLVTAGIVTDSNADTQTLTIAQGGLSGNALQWHAIAADSKRVTIPLQAGDVTDWTDAQELWVYVDQSAYMKPGSTNYTQNSNSFGLGFVAGGTAVSYANGASVQYYENGRWVTSPYVEWGRASIPGYYKGWVRVALNAANFGGLDMTKLNNVTALTIEVGHPAGAYVDNQADNACLVDAVSLLYAGKVDPASPVNFTQVHIDDPYWSAYQKLFICEVIPTGIANVELPTGGIPNIINAAKMHRGEPHGGWQGEICGVETDVFKLVEAMCFALQMDAGGDAEIAAGQQVIRDKLTEWVGYMVDLPDETGYIYTYYTLRPTAQRWTNWDDHELYNSGHFFEMAVAYYNVAGSTALLDVAVENADMLCRTFGPANGQIHQVPGHPEVELALIKLANACLTAGGAYADRADDYVALCQYFVDLRGDYSNRTSSNPHSYTYNQDHAAMIDQREAVGHAVRAGYTYTGVADLALYTKTDAYTSALQAIWEDIAYRKSYITGGIGSVAGIEGFGGAYELSNAAAYNETCASCAQMFFSKSMGLLYGNSCYADEIERNLYNILLASMNMEGDRFFYNNRMQSDGSIDRQSWYGCACCPPNLMRTVMSIGGYIYNTKDTTLTIDQYIGNTAAVTLDGAALGLDLDTTMPWEGQTTLTLSLDANKEMTLRFRLPYWATGTNTAKVNGSAVPVETDGDGYLAITRTWANGDTVALDFAVEAHRVYSDERVTTNAGLVAVQRGPFIYAAEEIDNEVIPQRYVLSTDAAFTTTDKDILPAADDHYGIRTVKIITADAQVMHENGNLTDATLTLVPYYAWNNRGKGNMTVYLHEEPTELDMYTPEVFADATASGSQSGYGPENLNDETDAYWASDATTGTAWVQYAWGSTIELSSLTVTWLSGTAGARLPSDVVIEVWNGTAFVPVTLRGQAPAPVNGQAVTYDFQPVETDRIRLVITLNGRAAIAEIRVNLNAAHQATGSLKEVLSFDNYAADTNASVLSEFFLLWGDRQWNVDEVVSITAKNSLHGNALNWVAKTRDSAPVGVRLPTESVDWSGAQEVWVYVDSSLYGNQATSFRLSFVAGGVESMLKDCSGTDGGVVYYQSGYGFVQATSIAWGRVTLPSKFKGWLRMPLSADTFTNFDAGRLSNVTSVGFEVGHTDDGLKSRDGFFIDAVSLLYAGEGDPLEQVYTVTAKASDPSFGTVTMSDNTIIAEPKEGCVITGYEVSPQGACTVTQNGNEFTVSNVTADCTVTILFANPNAPKLKITSAYLHIDENINIIYAATVPEDCTAPYMVFRYQGASFTVKSYTEENGKYLFAFEKLVPYCMGDNISATLYAKKDGKTVSDTVENYSIRAYCANQLAKTDDAKLTTLLSDLLTYGAAAQIYTGYKTNALVTDGLDLTPSAFTAIEGRQISFTGEASKTADWYSAALVMSNNLAMRFCFTAESVDGLSVDITINDRTQTFDDFESLGEGKYALTFRGIKATEFDDTVTASFIKDGNVFGRTICYSVSTYICDTQDNESVPNLAQLMQAVFNYGASAKAYNR